MKQVSSQNFGLLIAYVLPGFVALFGLAYFSDTVAAWLQDPKATPTVGGFLYVTLASVAAGLTVSTVRWAVIDTLHHRTGIRPTRWDFARLQQHFDAYDRLEQNHYRYYQWYSGMVVSLIFVEAARLIARGITGIGFLDLGILLLTAIFFAGSRDTLAKFYLRTGQLLSTADPTNLSSPPIPVRRPATSDSAEPPVPTPAFVQSQC